MNPAARTPAAARGVAPTRHQASWEYAEQFVPPTEHAQAARDAADQSGVSSVTQGGAALLTQLARLINARAAVEIGTGAGVSSLAILSGMAPDGILTSIDSEAEHQAQTRRILDAAGFPTRRARLIAGAALNVLPKLSDGAYDLVLVDGDPLEYVEYVAQAARLLRSGGVLVISHALADGRVPDETNEDDETVITREALAATTEMEEFSPILLPVSDGMLVAIRA